MFDDIPDTLAQSRRLQNAGIKADFSYSKGINTFKAGAMFYHTFLHEGFSLGVTDPSNNPPCFDASGKPVLNPAITNPGQCAGFGYTVNENYNASLGPYDLTRGGTLYHFNGRTDIKQEAIYLQDNVTYKNVTFLLGGRVDNYNGISRRSLVQPRLGVTYNVRQDEHGAATGIRQAVSDAVQREPDCFELYRHRGA